MNARLPPHSLESERAVLGGVIIRPESFFSINGTVHTEDFYFGAHGVLWDAVCAMNQAHRKIDLISVTEWLKDAGTLDDCDGFAGVADIVANTATVISIDTHAQRVHELSQRRKVIAFAGNVMESAFTTDSSDLSTQMVDGLADLMRSDASTSKSFDELVDSAVSSTKSMAAKGDAKYLVGAPTGLETLDKLTGGFSGPRLIVIAARPKMGKSTLLNQFAIHAARNEYPGLICSIELGGDEIAIRGLSHMAQVNVSKLYRGYQEETDRALDIYCSGSMNLPLWVDDKSNYLEKICTQITVHKHRFGIKWAAVDHVGLVRTHQRFNSNNDRIGHVTWTLKQLAKTLNIPIIALSQLSRKVESESRRPQPSDLRDSGNIEQDLDTLIMLHKAPHGIEIGVPLNRTGPAIWPKGIWYEFNGGTQTFVECKGATDEPAQSGKPYSSKDDV